MPYFSPLPLPYMGASPDSFIPSRATADWQALDAAHYIHPFTDHGALSRKGTRVVTRAEGVYLYDSDGRQILDGMSGPLVRESRLRPPRTGRRGLSAAAGAAVLQQLLPGRPSAGDRARAPAGRGHAAAVQPCVLHRLGIRGQRHRRSLGAPLLGPDGASRNAGSSSAARTRITAAPCRRESGRHGADACAGRPADPGIVHIRQPYWYGEGGELSPDEFGAWSGAALEEKILEIGPERVAAFIGASRSRPPAARRFLRRTYWPEVQRIVDRYGILLVADEVICGFGRTGHWFGSEFFGIRPRSDADREGHLVGLSADRRRHGRRPGGGGR